MIERAVLEALQTAAIAAVAASSKPDLFIKAIGRTVAIPDKDGWLELLYLPNNIENEFWDSGKTYRGIFRMLLHWPLNDKGPYEAMNLAAEITAGFMKGSVFVKDGANIWVTDHPNMTGVLENPPEMLYPISVRYNCFKA